MLDPIEHIQEYLQEHSLTHQQFSEKCKINRSAFSQCISRTRNLPLSMIRNIAAYTDIPLEILIKKY